MKCDVGPAFSAFGFPARLGSDIEHRVPKSFAVTRLFGKRIIILMLSETTLFTVGPDTREAVNTERDRFSLAFSELGLEVFLENRDDARKRRLNIQQLNGFSGQLSDLVEPE